MKMANEQRIAAPRQMVWEALNDPEVLRASIPGCQHLEKESDNRLSATVEVKVGPIGARFKGHVTLTDLDPPNGYTLLLEGNGGISGNVRGTARVQLVDEGSDTRLRYSVDAEVGGRMAQLGGPILDATARQLAGKFFTRFAEQVCGEVAPAEAAVAGKAPVVARPTPSPARVPATGFPTAWVLATALAALIGFLVGRTQGADGSDWAGIAIGLLLMVIAAVAFEYGKRSGSTVVTLDRSALRGLLEDDKP